MTFAEVGNEGALNGTTPVTVIASPASSTRRLVKSISFFNNDTVAHTITLKKIKATVEQWRTVISLASLEEAIYDRILICDATDESYTAVVDANHTTTEPSFDVTEADAS